MPMCHNCSTKAFRLSSLPHSLEGLRARLARDRRWGNRRDEKGIASLLPQERRVGERRFSGVDLRAGWMDAEDLIIEVIELRQEMDPTLETTRIVSPIWPKADYAAG